MIRTVSAGPITRRSLLRGGVACALASAVPSNLLGETIFQEASQISSSRLSTSPLQPELYAFRGAGQGLTAIAVTWAEETTRDCMVRIHAGAKTWQFNVPSSDSSQSLHHSDYSLFIGSVVAPAKACGSIMTAVVMEVDARAIGQHGRSPIWAERMVGGLRQRIGAPFLSNIMRDNADLASLYHSSSPDKDRTLLLQPLSVEIARRLRVAGSVVNPDSHARRLAYALLPDVLHYDSRLPAGFTFAAQNGLHPSESPDEVVSAILNGGKPSDSATASHQPSVKTFPYFEQLTKIV
jgi:hypothetical protein